MGGPRVRFTQTKDRLVLRGLPETAPSRPATVIELHADGAPKQVLGAGMVVLK